MRKKSGQSHFRSLSLKSLRVILVLGMWLGLGFTDVSRTVSPTLVDSFSGVGIWLEAMVCTVPLIIPSTLPWLRARWWLHNLMDSSLARNRKPLIPLTPTELLSSILFGFVPEPITVAFSMWCLKPVCASPQSRWAQSGAK